MGGPWGQYLKVGTFLEVSWWSCDACVWVVEPSGCSCEAWDSVVAPSCCCCCKKGLQSLSDDNCVLMLEEAREHNSQPGVVKATAARGATVTPPNATTGAQRLHCSRQRRHYRTVLQVPSADDLTERVQKAVGFPCFVKPNRNSGSLGISKVQDRYTNILQ